VGFTLVGLQEKAWFGVDVYIFTKLIQEPKEENFLFLRPSDASTIVNSFRFIKKYHCPTVPLLLLNVVMTMGQ
jgi:hypothetical protein